MPKREMCPAISNLRTTLATPSSQALSRCSSSRKAFCTRRCHADQPFACQPIIQQPCTTPIGQLFPQSLIRTYRLRLLLIGRVKVKHRTPPFTQPTLRRTVKLPRLSVFNRASTLKMCSLIRLQILLLFKGIDLHILHNSAVLLQHSRARVQ